MARYVAFLRGMNLGRRRIKNQELCACFEAIGLADVSAFLASGNVIFTSPGKSATRLEQRIAQGLSAQLDYEVPTIIRSVDEIARIALHRPFPASVVEQTTGNLQVALLAAPASSAGERAAMALSTNTDRLALDGRELYWLPEGKMSDSELDMKALASALGLMTIRTQRTFARLHKKLDAE